MACTNQRDAACRRPRDHPNAGVDGDSAENVHVRSIILHHIGNCGSRYSVVTESLTPENWLIRQAVPRILRRAFSVPAFHTTDESVGRRTRPVGNALTVRAGRISRTIRSSFFKSDSSAFWRRLEDQGSGHHTPLEKITCPVRFTAFKASVPQMLK